MPRLLIPALLLIAALACSASAQDVFQEGQTITVELSNGDKLTGILLEAGGARLVIQHDVFGRMEIPRASIKPAEPEPPAAQASPWAGKYDLALTGSGGNTETQNFRTSLDVRHDDEDALDVFTLWYLRNESDGETSAEKGFTQLRHEWKLSDSKWRPFVQGSFETDKFTDYDARASVAGGLAYPCLEGDVHKLTARAGFGVSHKYGLSDPTIKGTSYEALIGWDYFWTLTELSRFSFIAALYPSDSDSGEYHPDTNLAWESKVDKDSAWYVKLGLDTFSDTQPGSGQSSTDNNYYVGLGRVF
jgi:putative salt-induced outer membrane protein YdiY